MNKIFVLCLAIGFIAYAQSQLKCATEGGMCAGRAGIQCCADQGLRCYVKEKNGADFAGECVKGCGRESEMCGGNAGFPCCEAQGLRCQITQTNISDAMGDCVKSNECKDTNEKYNTCGTACPLTCKNFSNPPQVCIALCVTGCFCSPPYARDETTGKCVKTTECVVH